MTELILQDLSPRSRKALALGILVLAIVIAWLLAIQPLISLWSDTEDGLDAQMNALQHYRAFIARKPTLEKRRAELDAALQQSGELWTGAGEPVVVAAMQASVSNAITQSGGVIRSIQSMPVADEQTLRRLTLRLTASGTIEMLAHSLALIEAGKPLVHVDTMEVSVPESTSRNGMSGHAPELTIRMDLIGYLLPGGQ